MQRFVICLRLDFFVYYVMILDLDVKRGLFNSFSARYAVSQDARSPNDMLRALLLVFLFYYRERITYFIVLIILCIVSMSLLLAYSTGKSF